MADEDHYHTCMECFVEVDCDPEECEEDPYEETLCMACLKEQAELVEEEND